MKDSYDLLVIGGGVNGTGIARDAAGRGLSVLLCERGDLAEGTSSRSTKLIHGGLRYLEYYAFRLVREALIEREVLLRAAPHIVWPMRFVLPHSPEQRAVWMIRMGLFLYDHLGGRERLPGTRKLDLQRDPEGEPIKEAYVTAFEYSDCWVDDARLPVLNALDAAAHGADILVRTAAVSAHREHGAWQVVLADEDGTERRVAARGLINAAGPWVEEVMHGVVGANAARRVRLVKGSHIVLRRFWSGAQAYLLQNDDGRVVFIIPYEHDLALVGSTDIPFEGDAADVAMDDAERDYLLRAINRYTRRQFTPADIVHAYSGVRPLYDDNAANPSAVTRDYVFDIEDEAGRAPLLSVFGGKLTTFRRLAEHAMRKLGAYYPGATGDWTRTAPLPGGDMPNGDYDTYVAALRSRRPWLADDLAQHYARLYGTRAEQLLDGASQPADLGRHFGGRLYAIEADFLRRTEWAKSAADILARRTKHHLHMTAQQCADFATWMGRAT
jgi:glycerol-3-phosphate dehydrogenase